MARLSINIKSRVARRLGQLQRRRLNRAAQRAIQGQEEVFRTLIRAGRKTAFGRDHGFDRIQDYEDFRAQVPVRDYEANRSWFERIVRGEADVSWPGKPEYLAKTSGTTSGAKYIPLTREMLQNQIAGARDALLLYAEETGNADFFDGRMMFISGSPEVDTNAHGVKTGRLSGIVNHFVPKVLLSNRVPSYDINIIEDWEEKMRRIALQTRFVDLRLISGIPPWVQMFFEELERQTGRMPLEIWPRLSVFVHGGVNFEPYQSIFDNYFGDKVDIVETYPASEGFFAFQDRRDDNGLLLLTERGIWYEFIPLLEYGQSDARRLTLAEVELGEQYAVVISTNAGLWAYDLGDTVRFVSLDPYKIRVTGRVKHFLSAFGEHVIAEEVNAAILEASKQTNASFREFTVAPAVEQRRGESYHEWFIEFDEPPTDFDAFTEVLDLALRARNPYYEDLRAGNILRLAQVRPLQPNACRAYMKSIGKLGGQNKFPRLTNDRKVAEKLMAFVKK